MTDRGPATIGRRALLNIGVVATAAAALPGTIIGPATRSAAVPARPTTDPFTLGVASGEPAPDGFVLWTRLAVDPLADDGLGGMGTRWTDVDWELASDPSFRLVMRRGRATTGPELGHSVHVELAGLPPGREYFYRFRAGVHVSPAGRVRTAPAPTEMTPLTLCFTSCAQYEHGFFTAYRRLAEDEPDLILHVGDYLYEYPAGTNIAGGGNIRGHVGPETTTLAGYRQRHAQYRTDADLQAAHAAAPWLVVFDDHEVQNNWADDVAEQRGSGFPARRAAALRAYWENMPLRSVQRPRGEDMQLYRRVGWGGLATFHMLDTRQYRDEQAGNERFDPARSMPGSDQERWIADGFHSSRARWDVLGQQVFFSQLDFTPGAGRGFNDDAWDGYPASRDRVVDSWVASGARNLVVLTGDVHAHWGADVKQRFDDPASRVVGSELVTSSVSAGGDGSETRADVDAALPENPHIRFYNNRRGYVRTRFTASEVTAEFRVVPTVREPEAPGETRGTVVIEDRRPGLQRV